MRNSSFFPEQKSRTSTMHKGDLRLLLALRKDLNGITVLSKELSKSKSTVHGMLKKLIKQGVVKKRDSLYYLTKSGQMACSDLGRLPSNNPIVFRLHKYTFSASFLKKSKGLEELLAIDKRFCRHYQFDRVQFHTKKDSVTVNFYPNSISFVLPPIFSPDLNVAEGNAVNLANFVVDLIESEFCGAKVGTPKVSSHVDDNHIAVVNHPLALEFDKFRKKYGETYSFKGDKIEIDFSPDLPELEFVDKLNAKQDCYKLARVFNNLTKGHNSERLEALLEKLDSYDKNKK